MNIYLAGTTRDNHEVYYTHRKFNELSDEKKKLIAEVLPKYMYEDFPLVYTFAFDRIVGSTFLVEVEDYQKERYFWVYRKSNPNWKVPVLLNGTSRMTTYMTLVFKQRDNKVFVADCFFGKRVPPLPGNPDARRQGRDFVKKCQSFWQNHALALSQDAIDVDKTIKSLKEEEKIRFLEYINT